MRTKDTLRLYARFGLVQACEGGLLIPGCDIRTGPNHRASIVRDPFEWPYDSQRNPGRIDERSRFCDGLLYFVHTR